MYVPTKYRQLRCKGCGSVGFNETPDSRWWLPGVVVLELKQPESPGRIFGPTDANALQSLPVDAVQLRKIVDPLLIKPPEWTFAFKQGAPPTEKDYERFITLRLQPDVDVPAISRELRKVRGVRSAAGEPRLEPPRKRIPFYERKPEVLAAMLTEATEVPLLDEPLAVSGGALGKSITVGVGAEQLSNQWYLFRSQADGFLQNGITGAGVVVADIDWGFKVDHQEFANDKIKFKYSAVTGTSDVSSATMQWHGTGTLGLIGAGDNNKGMLGFAPGADLWAIQAQSDNSPVDNSNWAKAIEEVRLTPSPGKRKVILVEAAASASRNVEASYYVRVPIKKAIEKDDCVVCVTAGNGGVNAGFDAEGHKIPPTGSILVGATQYGDIPSDIRRADSNWGSRVVVSAPGASSNDVTCCDCGVDRYRDNFGGTSGAAAKVAGAMALLLQAFPAVKNQEIVEVMKTKMPQIATSDQPMGCFLDIKKLMDEVGLFLSHH